MKNQYVGDIGDYGKYGLLRFLAGYGIRIGVNWYLTKNDSSSDGKFIKYLNDPDEAMYDKTAFDLLGEIAVQADKSVENVEKAGLIAGAVFYHENIPEKASDSLSCESSRRSWFQYSLIQLKDADLIFADPDNGISYRKKAENKGSEKYILPEEIAEYYNCGQNVVFYCHKGRRSKEAWEQVKIGIKRYLPDSRVIVLTFHRGTQRSYIFVMHPDSYEKYEEILEKFVATDWGRLFSREAVGEGDMMASPGKESIAIEALYRNFVHRKT